MASASTSVATPPSAVAPVPGGAGPRLIEARGLTLQGGPRTLVRRLDWSVAPGECWAVLGANGAGKSSLLAVLAGVRRPSEGDVIWSGPNANLHPQPARRIGLDAYALAKLRAYLPQQIADAFSATVLDTVMLGRYAYGSGLGWEDADALACGHRALAAVGLGQCGHRDVRSLSGGERQRVALAMLLAQDAPLMLLDEPLSHQDPGHQVAIGKLLASYADAASSSGSRLHPPGQGHAVVMALHDVNHALRYATHALVLLPDGAWAQGEIREVVTPAVLERAYGHPFRAVRDAEFTWMAPA